MAVEKAGGEPAYPPASRKRMAAFSDAVYKRRVQPDAVPLGRKYVLQISAEPMKEKNNEALQLQCFVCI